MKRNIISYFFLVCIICTSSALCIAATARVGFFSEEFRYGEAWRRFGLYSDLKEQGMTGNAVNSMQWVYGKMPEDKIYAQLCQYHAIVLSLDRCYASVNYDISTRPYRNALRRYLEAGGGVLLVVQNGEYQQDKRPEVFNLMFKEYGIQMLREGIYDPEHEFSYPGHPFLSKNKPTAPSYLSFFYTKNITASPITEGVKCLYFPLWGCGGMWATMGLTLDEHWQVAVRGEKSAKSYITNQKHSKNSLFLQPGQLKSAPALAATRSVGKGRLAVISCNLMHLTINAHACDWPAVFEKNGDGVTASDGHKLLFNALKFLSENALSNPKLGTYVEKDTADELPTSPMNLDGAHFAPKTALSLGTIGLHSALSDGTGTIEDYAEAAKHANLQFIVFTENFEQLTPEKYATLQKECRRLSTPLLYLCPGIEFPDGNGLRWAFWGEDVRYPNQEVLDKSGKRVGLWGLYAAHCNRRPSASLEYNKIRTMGSSANLWWYFRVPTAVYRRGRLVENDLPEYLFALSDLRNVGTFIYNGVYAPGDLKNSVDTCGWSAVSGNMATVKKWLNTKNCFDYELGYATQGPVIDQWSAIMGGLSMNFAQRPGWQRIRIRAAAHSKDGLKELRIYSGTDGIIRRYDGKGQSTFEIEFEEVRDRVRRLVLEVIDARGRSAISSALRLDNAYYGLERCTDNMNHLGFSTLLMHPAQHEIPSMRNFEDIYSSRKELGSKNMAPITGIDSGIPFLFAPTVNLNFNLFTTSGNQLGGTNQTDDFNATENRYPVNGIGGPSILTQNSHRRVVTKSRHKPERRVSYAHASFFPLGEEQPIADIQHTSVLLRSRIIPSMRFTLPWLADANYQGGIMLHRIAFTFKKDVELSGPVPLQLLEMTSGAPYFNASRGFWNDVVAMTSNGAVTHQVGKEQHGQIQPGGYLSVLSNNSARRVVIVPIESNAPLRYSVSTSGTVHFGMCTNGQKIKKGDSVSITMAVVAQVSPDATAEACADVARQLSRVQMYFTPVTGTKENYPGFAAFHAIDGECELSITPTKMICDAPLLINGLQDNGCAAYIQKNTGCHFIFAPVHQGKMAIQVPTEKQDTVWCGNIFLSDSPELRITVVCDGQSPGKPPFVEIHNPTDHAITSTIFSPSHTPIFGGKNFKLTIPAGSSKIVSLKKEK